METIDLTIDLECASRMAERVSLLDPPLARGSRIAGDAIASESAA
jgi:hypothetical protein